LAAAWGFPYGLVVSECLLSSQKEIVLSTYDPQDSTVAIHGGRSLDCYASSILFPLYQTSTFVHDSIGVDKGFSYSRISNPTVDALEKAIGAWDEL
jgi:cystathionine beta-lyase/cystathionine gamma-synthase